MGRLLLFLTILMQLVCVGESLAATRSQAAAEEELRLGERMFRQGILPSGAQMQAALARERPVPGSTFTCEGCHLRSGLGAYDEGVNVPATGAQLFKPLVPLVEKRFLEGSRKNRVSSRHRPPYTDAALSRALRDGIDSAGHELSEAMPRFQLAEDEMAVLISYLKTLSAEFSPGASPSELKFATVVTDDADPAERDAMLISLLGFIDARNRRARLSKQVNKSGQGSFVLMRDEMMDSAAQTLSLSIWRLKGPPATWRSQLEEYYRNEPVFALLGGISKLWQPVHDFCEENRIPCLLPRTDFPVVSRNGWYTVYLTKGLYEEGEAAARYLDQALNLKGRRVVEIVRDSPEGQALSQGFHSAWQDQGHEPPVSHVLKLGEALDPGLAQQLLSAGKAAALLLWDGEEAERGLHALAPQRDRPEIVMISSGYLGKELRSLSRDLRYFTYITCRKESDQGELLSQMVSFALMDMRGNYYRDYFLDVIGMMGEVELRPHGRLDFGATQRYLRKGYVVHLSRDGNPEVATRGDAGTPSR